MSLSDVEVAQVVAELAPELAGATVGKVHEQGGHTLLLDMGRRWLLLSAHPRASRLHLLGERRERREPGAAPSGFAMLLRKRLGGMRLRELRLLSPGERVVVLDFGEGRDRLVAELSGPHANVFLLGADGAMVASLRPSRSTTRPLSPGEAYAPPPPAPASARWRGGDRFGPPPGVNERVAAHYAAQLAGEEAAELRDKLGAALRRQLERLSRRERALVEDRRRAAEAAVFRKYGDLLLAHLHELPGRGARAATVPDDFEDGAPISITLDPQLDAKANAARYYKQHKRLTAGQKRIDERLAQTRAAVDALRERLLGLDQLDLETLRRQVRALPPELLRRVTRRRERDEPEERLPYREFRSLAGDVILVGRSAADNDALTFGVARGNDLWLHTRDAAGAHVVVRRARSPQPLHQATLLDAATLAAHHSPLAKEAQVDVSYTLVKNLRKPRGAPPGLVYVSDAKTIRVRLESERLARLLAPPGEDI